MSSLSVPQRWALAVIRSVSGFTSLAASSIIIFHVLLRFREDQRASLQCSRYVTPYHRLLLGLSLLDVTYSFWAGLSTIPVPASSGVIYGFGTTATCSMQGFFTQFVAANPIYMASLSLYFMLKIRFNVSDEFFHQRLEFWFHLAPWVFAIGTGCAGVALKIFNPMSIPEMGCWLGSYPIDCLWTGSPCTRGYRFADLVDFYAIFFAHAWIFGSFLVVLVANILIYSAIRAQERRNERYSVSWLQRSVFQRDLGSSRTGATHHHEGENRCSPAHTDLEDTTGTFADDNLQSSTPVGADPSSSTIDNVVASMSAASEPSRRTHGKTSRTVFVQSTLYVSTSFFTAIWIILPYLGLKMGLVNIHWRLFFAIMVNGMVPLQGLFDLIIYVRLPYLRRRIVEKDWSRWQCIKACLLRPDFKDTVVTKRRRTSLYSVPIDDGRLR
jgi:hypothetical protein